MFKFPRHPRAGGGPASFFHLVANKKLDPRIRGNDGGRARDERGFTLVELMVVIVILGLLATIVAINVLPATGRANTEKAKADIATIEQALEMYRLDNLTYPSGTDALQALVAPPPGMAQPQRYRQSGYIKRLPDDPWGNPYRYIYPGQKSAFDVFSLGADGQEGGEGENADIGNWQ